MTEVEQCPRCGKALVVHGSFSTRGLKVWVPTGGATALFPEPPVPRSAGSARSRRMRIMRFGLVRAGCRTAKQKLRDLGNEDVRQRLASRKDEPA